MDNEWRDVKIEMPEDLFVCSKNYGSSIWTYYTYLLVTNGSAVSTAKFGKKKFKESLGIFSSGDITHWKYLPDPPIKENKNEC